MLTVSPLGKMKASQNLSYIVTGSGNLPGLLPVVKLQASPLRLVR